MSLILGVDQGTSATKAVLIDEAGAVQWEQRIPVSLQVLDAERVEQDPLEILNSIRQIISEAKSFAASAGQSIKCFGLALQRSGVCAWGPDGTVLHPIISHRDTRTRATIENLEAHHSLITEKCGIPVLPSYAGPKIALLQKMFPDPAVKVGSIDSYLMFKLSSGVRFVTDDAQAARSMLYNLHTGGWDAELCKLFQIDSARLAQIVPCLASRGEIEGLALEAVLGDQQAALLALIAAGKKGVLNFGTIASVSIPSGAHLKRVPGFVSSVLYSSESSGQKTFEYLIEAVTKASGSSFELLKRLHSVPITINQLSRLCAATISEENPKPAVGFFPIRGTGTPDWRYDLPALIVRWNKDDLPNFSRAVLDSLGSFVTENILALKNANLIADGSALPVTGGGGECDYLLQYIANCSGVALNRVTLREATAYGAAVAALLGRGDLNSQTLSSFGKVEIVKSFKPRKLKGPKNRHKRWKELRDRAYARDYSLEEVFEVPGDL